MEKWFIKSENRKEEVTMKNLLIWYPKCSTCQKAKRFLEDNKISFEERHIVEDTPTKEELKIWIEQSNLKTKNFFNTSDLVYKEQNLKEKLPSMTKEEKLELLASNGMLIKRPLFISDNKILVGFKEKEWREII